MISINEWLALQQEKLTKFEEFFRQGQSDRPELFPTLLNEADWDEQFTMFEP
jgi:hypothetical protein